MGQAKQRGTFEQRKAEAVERNKEIAKLRAAYEATRPKGKKATVTTTLTALGALAVMAGVKGGAA